MNIQPKIEPGSSPTNSNNNLEDKSIHDLVMVLRGTCQWDTFDSIEAVLERRDMRLREEFHTERLLRLHSESEFRKREEIVEKEKIIHESYEALLKEVKEVGLADPKTIEELQKKNSELELEVENLKEKCVDGRNELDVLNHEILEMKSKTGKLESEVLELRKLNEKMVEDNNELVVLREMIGKLEHEVLELRRLKKKLLENSSAHDELRSKVHVLEGDKNDLADLKIKTGELKETMKKNLETISELRKENDKRTVDILLGSFYKKFRGLTGRVSRLEDDTSFEENEEENISEDHFRNDIVEEAAPLQRNEAVHQTLGVSASTQPQSKGSKDAQGASSGEKCWIIYTRKPRKTVVIAGSIGGMGTIKVKKDIEIMHLDVDNWCMSEGVHEKKAIYGLVVKNEDPSPSSSLVVQQKTKFVNAVDTVKRNFAFSDSETSTSSSSSDDSSFLDNLTVRSTISLAKKKKM
ncbi:restin homolog [Medicago truncatula]|uniref:restin homolog n=1 Tax=Medicago truncatula TaxID=3880 RepID=UPI000D2F421C|nr:restin homolog [Medicago truncatula]